MQLAESSAADNEQPQAESVERALLYQLVGAGQDVLLAGRQRNDTHSLAQFRLQRGQETDQVGG